MRLTPRARAERIDGIAQDADGSPVVKASVTAPPEDGRANEALLQLLAREWHVPRRDLTLVRGVRSRNKIVAVAGDPAVLTGRIGTLPQSS